MGRNTDCTIVGASFAGLACATELARAGVDVAILERKADAGEKLHTTGILVKDAIDQVALLDGLPDEFVRRIDGVRLDAPNLRHVDLSAPGYYFLATDAPELMRADRLPDFVYQLRTPR
jgi:flavin-dependent dehydrogenase